MKRTLLFIYALSSTSIIAGSPVQLFNGKDLTGWKGTGYIVEDGAIICTKKGRNLMTEKEYTNYVFEFEFKLPPGGNNGLGIHYPGKGIPAKTGIEVQILDNTHPKYKNLKPYQFHGGLYFLKAAKKGFLKPVGEWNSEKVTVNGPHVTVELNGTVINEGNLDELEKSHPQHLGVKRRSGHITFCGHGDPVQFRNIRITELPTTKKASPTPAKKTQKKQETKNAEQQHTSIPASLTPMKRGAEFAGFTPLYNGKNLDGWKVEPGHQGHWQSKGEVLHYDGKSTAKDKNLWTTKSYKDFILICDWRWAAEAQVKKNDLS